MPWPIRLGRSRGRPPAAGSTGAPRPRPRRWSSGTASRRRTRPRRRCPATGLGCPVRRSPRRAGRTGRGWSRRTADPRVLSRSRVARSSRGRCRRRPPDSSSAVGLVRMRTMSGISGSGGSASTTRSSATPSRRRSVTSTSARRTITTALPAGRAGGSGSSPPSRCPSRRRCVPARAQRAGVERVEGVQAAADAPDPPAEMRDQLGVFALDVAGDDGVEPERDQPGHQPFDDGGFPDAGLALHPGSGVGDQPGVQPARPGRTDRLGGEQVLADRHPRRGRPGGRGEREQPAHLRGGALEGVPAATSAARPPPATGQPQGRGTGRARTAAPGSRAGGARSAVTGSSRTPVPMVVSRFIGGSGGRVRWGRGRGRGRRRTRRRGRR